MFDMLRNPLGLAVIIVVANAAWKSMKGGNGGY